jgi:hypothetical protein
MVVIDVVLVVVVADVVVIVVSDVVVIVVMVVGVVASMIEVVPEGVVVFRTFVKRIGKRMAATASSNMSDVISTIKRRGFLLRLGRDNI